MVSRYNLGAVLLIGAERTLKHDDAVAVETQLNRILLGKLCPRGCRLDKRLSLPCQDVQNTGPLQHKVKVHVEAPDQRGVFAEERYQNMLRILSRQEVYSDILALCRANVSAVKMRLRLPGCSLSPSPTQIKP